MQKGLRHLPGPLAFGVIVTLLPLIALWNVNLGQISSGAVSASLAYTSLFGVIVFLVWLAVSHSPQKAALLTALTSLYVFSYGHLVNLLGSAHLGGITIGYAKLFAAVSLAFALACFWVFRSKQILPLAILALPVALLAAYNLVSITRYNLQPATPAQPTAGTGIPAAKGEDLPDIYYIVLDSYARDDILEEVLNFDNTPFLNALRQRGFSIPQCAYSNYDGTILSLASILNYNTLDGLALHADSSGFYTLPGDTLIHNNLASRTFRSLGYQFVTGRGYASFNDITASDIYLNYTIDQGIKDDLAEKRFANLYLNTTVFRLVSELYKNNPEKFDWLPVWLAVDWESDASLEEARFWYLQNNYMFATLQAIPEWPGSHFVYAHINAPHGPDVYRSDGSFRFPLDDGTEQERYVDVVTYINQQVLQVVDALLEKSQPLPIIIIQADHGIHGLTGGLDKHKILSAYFLPGELAVPPYDTITPVNNFRLILRNYFDPSIELLPDTLHVKFLNVYEDVPASCDIQQP